MAMTWNEEIGGADTQDFCQKFLVLVISFSVPLISNFGHQKLFKMKNQKKSQVCNTNLI